MSDPHLPAAFFDPAINDPEPVNPDVVLASNRGLYAKEQALVDWLHWKLRQGQEGGTNEDDSLL